MNRNPGRRAARALRPPDGAHVRRRAAVRPRRAAGARPADDRHLGRDGRALLEVVDSEGPYLVGAGGERWIDFTSGWGVGNLGWTHERLHRALLDFRGPDYVSPNFRWPPWAELASELVALAPGTLDVCFRATGGTEAVELALRAAVAHTERRRFLALEGAYHGNAFGSLAVGGADPGGERPFVPCDQVAPPLDERAAREIATILSRGETAAFILEPIPINLGVELPAPGFLRAVQAHCRRTGTLLIADEVATGFGRTGRLFACEHAGVEPDILCLAKALGGGLGPIGAMLARRPVARSFEKVGSFYSTYGWHPRSVAVALANVREWREHGERILAHANALSGYFEARLAAMRLPRGTEVRGIGLAIALRFPSERLASRVAERCREEGLVLAPEGDAVLLLPPLLLPPEVARDGLDILERCVRP